MRKFSVLDLLFVITIAAILRGWYIDHRRQARKVELLGGYKMSFTNFSTGASHSFGGTYLELSPNERLRYTDKFDDPNLPGEMVTTVSLKNVSCGTELTVVQEGVPAVIPAEA